MAKLEAPEEAKEGTEAVAGADLLIAIPAPVHPEELRAAAMEALLGNPADNGSEASLWHPGRTVIAFPAVGGVGEPAVEAAMEFEQTPGALRFVPYSLPAAAPSAMPWLGQMTAYQSIFDLARELGVSACAIVAFDLATLKRDLLQSLLAPLLEKRCELVMPVYPVGKLEALLTSSILAPLPRALYGRRVRFPLAPDFAISSQLMLQVSASLPRTVAPGRNLLWPASEAAVRNAKISQVWLNAHHVAATEGVDLSDVLAQTVGPLFAEMEANAALWQGVRGSQPIETIGTGLPPADGATADVRPMLETFELGFRNLQEVWSLVLPPVTLMELKRLTRMTAEQFRMPDELWVRIVYDFALAYRLRTLSRSHLLGALTPLYLGWVASYVLEVGGRSFTEAEQRVEKLARAYEEGKPYLLSRWRWPDRFNP